MENKKKYYLISLLISLSGFIAVFLDSQFDLFANSIYFSPGDSVVLAFLHVILAFVAFLIFYVLKIRKLERKAKVLSVLFFVLGLTTSFVLIFTFASSLMFKHL